MNQALFIWEWVKPNDYQLEWDEHHENPIIDQLRIGLHEKYQA